MSDAAARDVDESTCDEALSTAVLTIDGARRVGWAKAFDALRRVEALEEQVREMTDERKHLRRAYSRLVGLTCALPLSPSVAISDELAKHHAAERSFRHEDAYRSGRAVAERYKEEVKGWSEEDVRKRAAQRSVKRQVHGEVAELVREEANALGHDVEWVADDLMKGRVHCSCGDSVATIENGDAARWRNDHYAQVTHGMTFKKLRAIALGKVTGSVGAS